jgi:hypothetical protein
MKKSVLTLLLFVTGTCLFAAVQVNYMYMRHASCDCSGVVAVYGSGGNGTYTYKWNNGHTASGPADSITGLCAGNYQVTCYSGNDSVKRIFRLYEFGIDTVYRLNACYGQLGWINLFSGLSGYTWPLHTQWYLNGDSLAHDELELDSLHGGLYSYYLVDGKGCEVSGTVKIGESSPVFNVYASDTFVCYNGPLTVWYTPRFTLWNGEYTLGNSSDTLYLHNGGQWSGGLNFPYCGIDTAGCVACDDTLPPIEALGHPSNLTLMRFGDTIAFGYPNLNAGIFYTYGWSTPHGYIETAYNFIVVDTVGNYYASQLYRGCVTGTGSINISYLPVNELKQTATGIIVNPNPATNYITISAPPQLLNQTIQVYDVTGRLVDEMRITQTNQQYDIADYAKGVYIIRINESTIKIVMQ